MQHVPRRTPRRAALVLAALALGRAPDPAVAAPSDEDELLDALGDVALYVETEVLVASATRRVARLTEAPGTITVIEARELEERGILTLEEALRHVASFLFEPGAVGLTATIRDVEQPFGNKVLLLRDGRILNDVARGSFFVDLTQPLDDVVRIEVVRGPGSALYGANAFAGFVNLVTRRGDEVDGLVVRGTGGTSSLHELAVAAGGTSADHDWTATVRHAAREAADPVNPGRENASQRNASLDLHLGRGDSKGESWFLNAFGARVDAGVPGTFAFPTPGDERREERAGLDGFKLWEPGKSVKVKLRAHHVRREGHDLRERVDADFTPLSDRVLNQGGGLAYDAALRRLSVVPGSEEPDDPASCVPCDEVSVGSPGGLTAAEFRALASSGLPTVREAARSRSQSSFVETQVEWKLSKSNYLLGGVSARWDDLDDEALGDHLFRDLALFVEDEQRFFRDRLILLGSLRVDEHSLFGRTTSPRVSLIWSPVPKLVLKATHGRAFRSPNFVELYGATRVGTAEVYGQRRAVEEGRIPAQFTRRTCLDPGCTQFRDDVVETSLRQEGIETVELWTEWSPVRRLRLVLNLYELSIEDEVGMALDRNDVYALVEAAGAQQVRPSGVDYDGDTLPDFTIPVPSLFAVPGLEGVPTFGVFLNSPERTWGAGGELEVHARPFDWLQVDWTYSRRSARKGVVGDFVERDATSLDQQLVPQFGTRRSWRDQSSALVTFRRKERAWATLGLRAVGRPDESVLSGGGGFAADLTFGVRLKDVTLAATVQDAAGRGTTFDPERGAFAPTDPEWRVSVTYRRGL